MNENSATAAPGHVFVYGTLRPGDVRWHILEPFVTDEGSPDSVSGDLFDTGLGYPAAIFGAEADGDNTILGMTYELHIPSRERCLTVLDEVEGAVGGLYRRVTVPTDNGFEAWAYAYGRGLQLTVIPSGDWMAHRRQ